MTTLAELRQANLKEQQPATAPVPEPVAEAPQTVHAVPAVLSDMPALHLADTLPPTEEQLRGGLMLAQIHAATAKKTQYSSGAKVSIDMPPALFYRAKRYCSSHGNLSLRQICLELLAAYLDEEGA